MTGRALIAPLAALACAAAMLFFTACGRFWRMPLAEPLEDLALRDIARATLEHTYPPAFRMAQRLVVRAPGADLDLLGYLALERSGHFQALALADLGGRVLELRRLDGQGEVLSKPAAMPEAPLLDGVIGDIAHLFLPPPPGEETWLRLGDGSPLLLVKNGERVLEYYLSQDGRFILRSREIERKKIVREAVYEDYRLENPPGVTVPARIVLRNRHWRYRLEIELLEIEAGAIPFDRNPVKPEDSIE